MDEKLPELEPQVSHSFDIKIVSRKTLLKVLAPPQTHFQWNFSVSKPRSVYEISQYFFRWSIHMANNLILAISFDFKLNSNLRRFISYIIYISFIIFLKSYKKKLQIILKKIIHLAWNYWMTEKNLQIIWKKLNFLKRSFPNITSTCLQLFLITIPIDEQLYYIIFLNIFKQKPSYLDLSC